MKNLIKLFNDWEIQLLVLFSFTLQLFLFFVGNLRRHGTNMFLRFSIWVAYLGADLVAVYALGYLSRHVDATTGCDTVTETHPVAFFWAPFLLIHLGGQDTITAFSMEDNNLWLRHLLNMVVQVVLATYVFWKSIGRHNMELLLSGIFVFAAGVIKYGERIWSLRYGSMESLESSVGNQYNKHMFPESLDMGASYSRTVCTGLQSMPRVLDVFTGRSISIDIGESMWEEENDWFKLVGFELGMLHSDLYTKAVILRTRSGVILRCISQVTVIVAFVAFLISGNKQSYHRADIAVTYSLFIGGFCLEVCAVFISLMSPWTWVWLKAQGCDWLARLSWLLFCNDVTGWSDKKPLWSNVIGQCNLKGLLVHSAQEKKISWLSKLLHRKYTKGDKMMQVLKNKIPEIHENLSRPLRLSWDEEERIYDNNDFGNILVSLHIVTEAHLSQYGSSNMECSNGPVGHGSGFRKSSDHLELDIIGCSQDSVEGCRQLFFF